MRAGAKGAPLVDADAMTEDQAASLRELETAAAGGDLGGDAGQEAGGEVDPVEESRQLWGFVFATLGGLAPEFERMYPPDRVEKIAVAWVPLAAKRGWDLGAIFGQWGPEIMFAVAIVPPEIGRAVLALIRAKLARGRQVEAAPAAAPGEGAAAPDANH